MKLLALLAFALVACEGHRADRAQLIDGLTESPAALCSVRSVEISGQRLAELKHDRADTLIAVLPDERQVALLDSTLRVAFRWQFDKAGPRGVAVPTSAVRRGDTLLILDQQKPLVRRFLRDGAPLESITLPFIPAQLVDFSGLTYIVPAIVGRKPASLLYSLRDNTLHDERIVPADYSNVSVKMIGNELSIASLNGSLLLVHQFLTSRAYLFGNGTREFPAPIARAFKADLAYTPPLPLDDEALRRVPAFALSATSDRDANKYILLGRSGRMLDDRFEKVAMTFDPSFKFLSAARLPPQVGMIASLPGSGQLISIDEDYEWHLCRI